MIALVLSLSVPASAHDLTKPSGLTADDMRLLHNLEGLEQEFIDAEHKYGVRADFLAAVAALESGWGRYQFEENNIMGFGGMEFETPGDCINHVAEFLAEHYLRPEGMYYNGTTVEGVCVRYNGRNEWAEAIKGLMDDVVEINDTGDLPF